MSETFSKVEVITGIARRRRFTTEQKLAVVAETMINAWKKQAIEGMSGVFSGRAEAAGAVRDGEIDQLHAKIGQWVVERDFLRRASGR